MTAAEPVAQPRLATALVIALVLLLGAACTNDESPAPNASPTTSTSVNQGGSDTNEGWSTIADVDGVGAVQMRSNGAQVCARVLFDESMVEADAVEGSCTTGASFERQKILIGGAIRDSDDQIVAGGVIVPSIEEVRFVSESGEEFSATVEGGAWVAAIPSTEALENVALGGEDDSTAQCDVFPPGDLLMSDVMCTDP